MTLIDITSQYADIDIIKAMHLLYYVPRNHGGDEWTDQLLAFKEDDRPVVNKFCDAMAAACQGHDLRFDYVIRMLGSQERSSYGRWPPVQRLALAIANALQIPFVEHFLRKRRETPRLSMTGNRAEREEILRGSLYIGMTVTIGPADRILVVDDITTSGSTIRVITELVKQRSPGARVGLLCLAKTSHNRGANEGIQLT